jgi:hypothetical protein
MKWFCPPAKSSSAFREAKTDNALIQLIVRVTWLGKFLPIGRLFTLGSYLKIAF